MKKGDLVAVKREACGLKAGYGGANKRIVEEHGWLWFIVYTTKGGSRAKSLVTGQEAFWLNEELETHEEG